MSKTIYHNHHITPKCLLQHKSKEFINHPSNIIRVELKHHIALHKWLFMITGDAGCECAWKSMSTGTFHYDKTGMKYTQKNKRNTPFSSKHRKNISNAMIGKMTGEKNPMYNKTHSEEAKSIISKTHKNKILSNKHIKVLKSRFNGNYNPNRHIWMINGKQFRSSYEASVYYDVNRSTIHRWCNKQFIPLCYHY